MPKVLSKTQLAAMNARPLNKKPAAPEAPKPEPNALVKTIAEQALQTAEKALQEANSQREVLAFYSAQMNELLSRLGTLPTQTESALPAITGFKFNRNNNGTTESVTFIRAKRSIN
jgi:type IV secretory pathway VirB10-like protein